MELELVGAALQWPGVLDDVNVTAEDFQNPHLGLIWETMLRLHAEGHDVRDAALVAVSLDGFEQSVVRARELLLDAVSSAAIPSNVRVYAAKIVEERRRRDIANACSRAVNDLSAGCQLEMVVESLRRVADDSRADSGPGMTTWAEIETAVEQDSDWIVPYLLRRDDRLVVTGSEGAGKSVLIRQIAMCCSAGLKPFTLEECEPRSVLLVDCENPLSIIRRTLAEIAKPIRNRMRTPDGLKIVRKPEGLDLGDARNRMALRGWCRAAKPDLLVIGPVYKLHTGGDMREEDLARKVVEVIDSVRTEFSCAVILEHHAPKGQFGRRDLAPIGSSLWMRWPEFGIGLDVDMSVEALADGRRGKLRHWRGQRDERDWPWKLVEGEPGELPWCDERDKKTYTNKDWRDNEHE